MCDRWLNIVYKTHDKCEIFYKKEDKDQKFVETTYQSETQQSKILNCEANTQIKLIEIKTNYYQIIKLIFDLWLAIILNTYEGDMSTWANLCKITAA